MSFGICGTSLLHAAAVFEINLMGKLNMTSLASVLILGVVLYTTLMRLSMSSPTTPRAGNTGGYVGEF